MITTSRWWVYEVVPWWKLNEEKNEERQTATGWKSSKKGRICPNDDEATNNKPIAYAGMENCFFEHQKNNVRDGNSEMGWISSEMDQTCAHLITHAKNDGVPAGIEPAFHEALIQRQCRPNQGFYSNPKDRMVCCQCLKLQLRMGTLRDLLTCH